MGNSVANLVARVVALIVATSTAAHAAVLCQAPNGTVYAGEHPPDGCVPIGSGGHWAYDGAQYRAPDPFSPYDGQLSTTEPQLTPDRRHIVGKLRNDTSERLEFVGLNFVLYNGDGEQIESTTAIGQNLEPHETLNYEARILKGADAARVSLKSIDRH